MHIKITGDRVINGPQPSWHRLLTFNLEEFHLAEGDPLIMLI